MSVDVMQFGIRAAVREWRAGDDPHNVERLAALLQKVLRTSTGAAEIARVRRGVRAAVRRWKSSYDPQDANVLTSELAREFTETRRSNRSLSAVKNACETRVGWRAATASSSACG